MRALAPVVASAVMAGLALVPAVPAVAQEPPPAYTAVAIERAYNSTNTLDVNDVANGRYVAYRAISNGGLAALVGSERGREVVVRPPTGRVLAPGTYPLALSPTSTHGSVSYDGCHSGSGSLEIADIAWESGAPVRLTATYSVTCGPAKAWGDLRLASPVGYRVARLVIPPYGDQPVGAGVSRTLVVTAAGSEPVTFGAAALSGTSAAQFQVESDTCSGVTVPARGECAISVRWTPAGGLATARLLLPDDTRHGAHAVTLTGRGVQEPTAPRSVLATGGVDGIGVSASPPDLDGATLSAYRVYRLDGETWTLLGDATPSAGYLVDPQPPGTTATYAVSAVNSLGDEGPMSSPVTATVPTAPVPEPGDVDGTSHEVVRPRYASWETLAEVARTPVIGSHAPGRFTISRTSQAWHTFVAPAGTSFAVGSYSLAPAASATHAAAPVQCVGAGGYLVVHEAAQRADGMPIVFDARYHVTCEDGSEHHGDVRYRASRPLVAATVSPATLSEPERAPGTVGQNRTVTVTNAGTADLVLGTPATTTAGWEPTGGTCANATIAPGAACTLSVAFAPTAMGIHESVLFVPSNTVSAAVRVPLFGSARGVPTAPATMVATGLVGRSFLRWTPPASDGGARVRAYVLLRGSSPGNLAPITTLELWQHPKQEYVDPGGRPGDRRWYAVAAINEYGQGPASAPVEAVLAREELFYAADVERNGYRNLYSRPLDTGAPPALLAADGRDYAEPTLSPNGQVLVFGRTSFSNPHAHVLLVMSVMHLVPHSDYSGSGDETKPAFSPDGRSLAWSLRPSGATTHHTMIGSVRLSDGLATRIYGTKVPKSETTYSPTWLPNGGELVVVHEPSGALAILEAGGLYLVGIPGTSAASEATVSPDGNLVAWTRYEGEETTGGGEPSPRVNLRVSWIAGGAGAALTSDGYDVEPIWAADSMAVFWERSTRDATGTVSDLDVYRAAVAAVGTPGPPVSLGATPGIDETDIAFGETDPMTRRPVVMAPRPGQDFTGDGRADAAVFRPSNGNWYVRGRTTVKHGVRGDIPVPADYNGDRRADVAVFRPLTGTWYVRGVTTVQYGTRGDIPVPADYNGDGRTDIAVYRPSTGTWHVRGRAAVRHGGRADLPVPADYTGDRKADIAVFQQGRNVFVVIGQRAVATGLFGWEVLPTPGDYDGNGRVEYVAYHPRQGMFRRSDGAELEVPYSFGDIPVCADYDGDRRTDAALFRPVTGDWDVNGVAITRYGTRGDIPV